MQAVVVARRIPEEQRRGSCLAGPVSRDRKSTRLNSSHDQISYAVFCLKKKKNVIPLAGDSSDEQLERAVRQDAALVLWAIVDWGLVVIVPDCVAMFQGCTHTTGLGQR